jgi:hypothetical protein
MITLDATALSTVALGARGAAHLVTLDFLSGLQRFTTWPTNLIVASNTYIGVGGIGNIAALHESEDIKTDKLVLSLSIVNSGLIAAAVGAASEYRGRAVTISLQLIDGQFIPAGAAVLRWAGVMDKVRITRNSTKLADGVNSGTIELECTRSGMGRVRNAEGLRLTSAQRQLLFPGDLGLEYVPHLLEKPQVWLSKKFQTV